MKLEPVDDSALIASIGYDSANRQLAVKTHTSPAIYLYSGVPPEVAERFKAAPSKGGYFGAWIRGKYPSERINPDQAPSAEGTPP